jgi:hypothetical protein
MSAPGWYPDPTDLSRQRYFDGMTWTEEYSPIGAPMPAAGQPAKPPMSKGLKIGLGTGALALLLIALASIFSTEIKDLYAEVRGAPELFTEKGLSMSVDVEAKLEGYELGM